MYENYAQERSPNILKYTLVPKVFGRTQMVLIIYALDGMVDLVNSSHRKHKAFKWSVWSHSYWHDFHMHIKSALKHLPTEC